MTAIRISDRLSLGRSAWPVANSLPFHRAKAQPVLRNVCVSGLKENVVALPPIDSVAAVTVALPDGASWRIPNAPGKAASARIYAHLAAKHGGALTAAAAQEGLQLYGEYVQEAKQEPGSHPNIDLLFRVIDEGLSCGITVEQQQ